MQMRDGSCEARAAARACFSSLSLLGALPRHEAVISPVRVNLAAGELSRWLPADYSLVLRSSWLSPAEHDGEEKVDNGVEAEDVKEETREKRWKMTGSVKAARGFLKMF